MDRVIGARIPDEMYVKFKHMLLERKDTVQSMMYRSVEEYVKEVKND